MPSRAIIIGYLIFVLIVVLFYFNWQAMAPKVKDLNPQTFVINKGEGVKDIAAKLEEVGLIKNDKLFQGIVFLINARNKFWPGSYSLSPNMDLLQIIKTLISQPGPAQTNITIIEGWTSQDIAKYLADQGLVKETDWLAEVKNAQIDFQAQYDWLNDIPKGAGLEGFLFPDTYKVYQNTTSKDIIAKMLDNFNQKITPALKTEIKNQKKTLFQIIIMASLIEKEVRTDSDRQLVADIFWRRIAAGIPLQSDASLSYFLGDTKASHTLAETHTPSPYNTYLNRGLPPGPIDNPGLSSIQAAINPLSNQYWYFLSTPDGKTIFSKNLDEQNKNKALYLK
ncbi:MAG: endolytic transglycosylase MltG [Candidatus Parcubacteria bacterium]|nr:endolytic transglycosylase MltG [Candidatus Parcubacteria bacterium]